MTINYEQEALRLDSFKPSDSSHFWKPTPGKYKVTAESELEEVQPFIQTDQNGNPIPGKEPVPQVSLALRFHDGDVKKYWTIAKGQSKASTYGGLIQKAKESGYKLSGVEFTIVVISDGKRNKYTIV